MTTPAFNRDYAMDFHKAVYDGRDAGYMIGFEEGYSIPAGDAGFLTMAKRAEDENQHLFFHVATLKPEWANAATHPKGKVTPATRDHVLECPFLWLDCDAEKIADDTDPQIALKHYNDERVRVRAKVEEGFNKLGLKYFAKWCSGAGWQILLKLDTPITPMEAEELVGRLHVAIDFNPVVRNCNRYIRVPGSINWKNGKDGRTPAPCTPFYLDGNVTAVDDIRKALAGYAIAQKESTATGDIKIDWTKVKRPGWLQSVADLPEHAHPKLRIIVAHDGLLKDLNDQLIAAKLLEKAYPSWSEVTHAATAGFKHCGTLSPEQIAEALLAPLPFNQHIAKQKDQERAIERSINHSYAATRVAIAGVMFRDFDKYGKPRPTLANAVIAIKALGIEASFDLFHHRTKVTYQGDVSTIRDGLLTDDTIGAIRSLINNTYRIDCGTDNTLSAIKEIAWANAKDPVLDLLDDCQGNWDKVQRLDTWVITYLGVEDTKLNRAIGRLVLIAACRRARVPGCKFDFITVLEGPEGIDKSTAIRVLAGDENFSDQSILGASDKEIQEQLEGTWMHENADLAGMKRAEVESTKAFASRQVDRARRSYGRVREDIPRRSVEWATTNNKQYLQSQTGNRRWWPLETGRIDVKALRQDREQLLGEAATLEAAGESIMLDSKLWDDASEAQEVRRVADPWEDILDRMPDTVTVDAGTPQSRTVLIIHKSGDGYERVASADVLSYVLRIPIAQQNSVHGQRLSLAMPHAGWSRNKSGRVTINGVPARGYIRADGSLFGSAESVSAYVASWHAQEAA
jgi:predicted P-loop ATPase